MVKHREKGSPSRETRSSKELLEREKEREPRGCERALREGLREGD